jgi:murein DD-endopeptidase MepM/ murein hydrolase activator NlpD
MPPAKRNYEIIIADKGYPIDWPTYTFRDPDPGFDATKNSCTHHSGGRCGPGGTPFAPAKGLGNNTNRIRKRRINERSLQAAQSVIKQFVVHLDGCASAEMCFNVLHNERGLSCHFILDNDGTLYQTCDLIDCAYHAAGMNESSIGIELSNRGDAKKEPDFYSQPGRKPRDVVACSINGHKYVAFDFTPPQYLAMEALGKFVARFLPNIKLHSPESAPGQASWGTLYPQDLTGAYLRSTYSGYLGHYHITERKWDPGPFDFKKFLGKLAGRRSFPVGLHGVSKPELPEAPRPQDRDERIEYDQLFERYYDNNELEGGGGYFPVGPLDNAQLYHGGVHLHVERGTNVVAPIVGKIIAARNGPITDPQLGSKNFVLIKHNEKVGAESIEFYTLFFHLAEESAGGKKGTRLKWMAGQGWDDAEPGKIIALDPPEPVQAGDVIGHVGIAGPEAEAQLHFEVFTVDHGPVERADVNKFWTLYSGARDQRFCTNREILAKIERKKDGIITPEELNDAFRGDVEDRLWARTAVTDHYSEWSVKPDWVQALQNAPENKGKLTPRRQREIEEMYQNQILPTLWWDDAMAQRLGLPFEARVYTYHPIGFLRWLNDLTGQKSIQVTRKATAEDFAQASSNAMLDIDDTEGTSFVNEADLVVMKETDKLQLPDMADGYGD